MLAFACGRGRRMHLLSLYIYIYMCLSLCCSSVSPRLSSSVSPRLSSSVSLCLCLSLSLSLSVSLSLCLSLSVSLSLSLSLLSLSLLLCSLSPFYIFRSLEIPTEKVGISILRCKRRSRCRLDDPMTFTAIAAASNASPFLRFSS